MNEEKYVEMLENGELYDYITNLQQENEILETNFGELQNTIDNIAKLLDVPEGMCVEDVYDKVKDYKSRIEKAVEITKDLKQFVYDELVDRNIGGATETHCMIKDLLNILNGRSDE